MQLLLNEASQGCIRVTRSNDPVLDSALRGRYPCEVVNRAQDNSDGCLGLGSELAVHQLVDL